MRSRLVVIGNGIAGIRTVEELLISTREYDITVYGAEPFGNYNRIMLSSVLCGEKDFDDIVINDRAWYQQQGITLHAGPEKSVVEINRAKRYVKAKDGTTTFYDRLIIATGSRPNILPIPGHTLKGVIAFRDIFDVEQMLRYSASHQHAVVLGGGLLGLEAANGLAQQGMHVTVLHHHDAILNRQLDAVASALLKEELLQRGIHFAMPSKPEALLGNAQQHIKKVRLSDGTELPCDLFVMAIGINPNIDLAQSAGLYCDKGIVVNDCLQTYDPRIYAVGECVQHRGNTFGLVAPLFEQAKVCANHLSQHGVAQYKTLPTATNLKVTGIKLFSVGDYLGNEHSETLVFKDLQHKIYKKLIIKHKHLIGAVLYGETSQGAWYQQLLEQQTDISLMRPVLMFGQAYAEQLLAHSPAESTTDST